MDLILINWSEAKMSQPIFEPGRLVLSPRRVRMAHLPSPSCENLGRAPRLTTLDRATDFARYAGLPHRLSHCLGPRQGAALEAKKTEIRQKRKAGSGCGALNDRCVRGGCDIREKMSGGAQLLLPAPHSQTRIDLPQAEAGDLDRRQDAQLRGQTFRLKVGGALMRQEPSPCPQAGPFPGRRYTKTQAGRSRTKEDDWTCPH